LANARESAPTPFRVIVHPENRISGATAEFLSSLFLKKVTRWDGGETVRPVDQPPNSAVRARFSESVLKRSVAAVRNYWQQRVFSGRGVPPRVLESDQAVVSYVQKERGAVGYVSGAAKVDGVKVLVVK
jgi:ABC-type phosphate transport system substrate-binding protein